MEVMTQFPANDRFRIIIMLRCGCEAVADIPVVFFEQVEANGLPPGAGQAYIIGLYGADIMRDVESRGHNYGNSPSGLCDPAKSYYCALKREDGD